MRPRPGRRFEPVAEAALERDAITVVRALPHAHRGVAVLREAAGPFGIPDFVAVVGTQDALVARMASAVPPLLNQVDAGIVAVLSTRRGRTIDTIAASVGWSRQTVERRLPALVRATAISEVGPQRYVRAAALRPIGRIYAIETKMSDWRRAVRQARTYRLWCDNYVIVMASLSGSTLPLALDAIRADGGGLMSGGQWAIRMRSQHAPAARRLWGSEHVVAALGGPSPTFGSPKLPKPKL